MTAISVAIKKRGVGGGAKEMNDSQVLTINLFEVSQQSSTFLIILLKINADIIHFVNVLPNG